MKKWSEKELRKTFKTKIVKIETFLKLADGEDLLSDERRDMLASVAVELRALFCYSGGDPLIKTAGMTEKLIFPLYDINEPFSVLSEFMLVQQNEFENDRCTFRAHTKIPLDGTQLCPYWLSYKSWINEIVVDFKHPGYPPKSRADIIKIVAGKTGAHVDPEGHQYLDLMDPNGNAWLVISLYGENRKRFDVDCGNLLIETIYSIAKEAVFSYKLLYRPILMQRSKNKEYMQTVFDYSDERSKKYRYGICRPEVKEVCKEHNYKCEITTSPIWEYDLIVRGRNFRVMLAEI